MFAVTKISQSYAGYFDIDAVSDEYINILNIGVERIGSAVYYNIALPDAVLLHRGLASVTKDKERKWKSDLSVWTTDFGHKWRDGCFFGLFVRSVSSYVSSVNSTLPDPSWSP